MNPIERHDDWLKGISGSRRMTVGAFPKTSAPLLATLPDSQRDQENLEVPIQGESGSSVKTTRGSHSKWARCGWVGKHLLRTDRRHLLAFSATGAINGIEAIRGILFFGLLATSLWVEWIAIKALATYVSALI